MQNVVIGSFVKIQHPSLQFKKIEGEVNTYSVRIGLGYRALGVMRENNIVWFWVGTHAEYDRLL